MLRWEGQPAEDAIWVEEEWLQKHYPHLEVKVLEGTGSCNRPVKEETTEREGRVAERKGGAGEGTEMNKELPISILSKPTCTRNKGELACRVEMKERERLTWTAGRKR